MMNSFISLNSYLLINVALAISYLISRSILHLPLLKSQIQRLQFARYAFLFGILTFLIIPLIINIFSISHQSNFQLEPFLKNASINFLEENKVVNDKLTQIQTTQTSLSIPMILTISILIGIGISMTRYIKNLLVLNRLKKKAFCQHTINRVNILFSDTTEIPFCWSFFNTYFIAIPNLFLEKNADLKLAIRHELQHIRQGDTHWVHCLNILKVFFFWNPFLTLWIKWLDELQEFSCDESLVLRKKTSPTAYAQCLINSASDTEKYLPHGAIGIHGLSQSILCKRINMMFHYNKFKTKTLSLIFTYIISFFGAISVAYALNGTSSYSPLTKNQVTAIIKKSHLDKDFQISATPEVVEQINNIRSSDQARTFMRDALKRMKHYQPAIQDALNKNSMPTDLLAIPLIESGYKPLAESENPHLAAGIWQIIPETGKKYGLVINTKRDDRLNTELATTAALAYLKTNHTQFNNWKLAVIAYEIGEEKTEQLIKMTGSQDAWVLARSVDAPKNLKKFIVMFDAAVIIMHNPSLIS